MSRIERYLSLWVALCILAGLALGTVVGVLVEVSVMLTLVAFANRTRGRFPP